MAANRKTRRDAKLEALSEAQRAQVESWLAEDGAQCCLQRISAELGLTVSQTTLYETLARWRAARRFSQLELIARAQAEQEAASRGGLSVAQMEEAFDRHMISLAAVAEDPALYKELRYLRIADQTSKSNARIAEEKLKRKDAEIALAVRRMNLLEENAAKAKQALEAVKKQGGLSPETLAQIEEAARLL